MVTIEVPEDPNELNKWIKEGEEHLKKIVTEGTALSGRASVLLSEEQALMAQVSALARERRALEKERDDKKRAYREKQKELEVGKRRLEIFMSEKALADQLEEKRRKFEELTLQFKWRESAYDHQLDGASRLATAGRAILGDKRGLGKTLTSIAFMDMVQARKVLIIAPKDVLGNFQREVNYWAPHRASVVLGGMPKIRRDMFLDLCATPAVEDLLLFINYEAWRRDAGLLVKLVNIRFDTVIIDEAHNLKNASTEAFKGVRQIVYADNQCHVCGGMPDSWKHPDTGKIKVRCSMCLAVPENFNDFCSVKHVVPMTGTAILNKPQDIFPLLNLVDRVNFSHEKLFLQDFCSTNYSGHWVFGPGGEKRLTAKLGIKYIARDEKSAGVTFPPQDVVKHELEFEKLLYPNQAKVFEQILEYGAIRMAEDAKVDIKAVIDQITRLRQATIWPAGIVLRDPDTKAVLYRADAHESQKMDKASDIIDQAIEEGDRIVVFSQFKEALMEMQRRLTDKGISCLRYDGDATQAMRQEAQLDFDTKTSANHSSGEECTTTCPRNGSVCNGYMYRVILCHYKVGGVGLNLNAARQMIILDREWNPGKEDQAFGRIQRLNTKHDTIVHTIHIKDTIDPLMDALIEEKAEMIDGFERENNLMERMRQALVTGDFSV